MLAAAFAGDPLLSTGRRPSWAARWAFSCQFFPMFLLGALFGKLMDESRLVRAIADFMTKPPGERRAILADGRKQNGDVE